jgi:hypothetical protein
MKSDESAESVERAVQGRRLRLPLLPALLALAGAILLALHGTQARAQEAGAGLKAATGLPDAQTRAGNSSFKPELRLGGGVAH